MRAPLGLLLSALALGGCAKFPDSGARNDFTHLIFRFKMAAPINPNCRYIVAIRTLGANDITTQGPIPVADVGSKNGFVAGSPTNYIEYFPAGLAERYRVFRFLTKAEAPDPSDDNPINLGATAARVDVAYQNANNIDPAPADPSNQPYGDTLGFEIDLEQLTHNPEAARNGVVAIQFNILTMSYAVGTGNTGDRVMDALGDQRTVVSFNDYQNKPTTSSRRYSDSDPGSTDELENDTFSINGKRLPSVDVVDWTLEVRRP